MKQSELHQLRRLLGWVRCEIGQTPDELTATVLGIAAGIDTGITDDAKRRLVEAHDKARNVPKYIREAVKALEKLTGPGDTIGDAEPTLRKLDHTQTKLPPARMVSEMTPEAAKESFLSHGGWLNSPKP
jgi:hypothetical protein